jgi:hypothetical protein
MKDFRASGQIPEMLREQYPTERGIELMGKSLPQRHTLDFVLSFLNYLEQKGGERLSSEKVTFLRFGENVVRAAKGKHVLQVTQALDAEDLRRQKYWKMRKSHISEVICGTYYLFRPSLTKNGNLKEGAAYGEALHIKPSDAFEPVLDAYWRRWSRNSVITYLGNFFIGSDFLYGTFVNRSSDEVVKPVNLTLLCKPLSKSSLRNFIVTGSLTGTDFGQDTILHYPIALRRLKSSEIPLPDTYYGIENVNEGNFDEFGDEVIETVRDNHFSMDMLKYMNTNTQKYDGVKMTGLPR